MAKWILVYVTRHQIIGDLDPSGVENLLFKLARDIREKAEKGATEQECLRYIKDTLAKNAPSDEDTQRSAAKVVLSPDEAVYVINRLANYMQSKTKEVKMSETNIEHIYPKNPKDSEWGGKNNHKNMSQILWHIGNLTVFGKRLNQGAGNKEFPDKKKEYATKTEVVMTRNIANQFSKEVDWTASCVEQRGKELAALVPIVWDFNNPSRV